MEDFDGFALFELAAENLADGVFAEIIVGGEGSDEELGAFVGVFVDFRGGNVVDNGVENDMEVVVEVGGKTSFTVASNGIINRVAQLGLVGGELEEEVGDFAFDFSDTGGGFVDFVDDDDRLQMERKRLLEDEFSLRHWAFLGVNDEEDAVGHVEGALDFAREISVAWGIDDVDFVAVVVDGGLLRGDSDATLVLLVHGVHDERLRHLGLIVAESVRLLQKSIDESGFTMVDVSNNGDVTNIIYHILPLYHTFA